MSLLRTHRRLLNRILIAAWLIYLPIVELGTTGSWEKMLGTLSALALMVLLGWLERDYREMSTTADELSDAQKEFRKWRVIAMVSLTLMVCLVGVAAYLGIRFFNQPKMVEAKSDLDPAVLALTNNACKIFAPNGEWLDGKRQSTIPSGSYITQECFGASHN